MTEPEPWAFVEDAAHPHGLSEGIVYRPNEARSRPAQSTSRLWILNIEDVDELRALRRDQRPIRGRGSPHLVLDGAHPSLDLIIGVALDA